MMSTLSGEFNDTTRAICTGFADGKFCPVDAEKLERELDDTIRVGDIDEGGKKGAGCYTWLHGNFEDPESITPAPAALVQILRERKKQPEREAREPRDRRPLAGTPLSGDVDDDVRKYALSALDSECRDVGQAASGGRNAQLNESAFKIATLVAAGALSDAVARSSLEAAARSNPGHDDERQLFATLDSGWTAGLQQPRDLSEIAASARARRERGPPRQSARNLGAIPIANAAGRSYGALGRRSAGTCWTVTIMRTVVTRSAPTLLSGLRRRRARTSLRWKRRSVGWIPSRPTIES